MYEEKAKRKVVVIRDRDCLLYSLQHPSLLISQEEGLFLPALVRSKPKPTRVTSTTRVGSYV
jgi:hypothetical protein